jgi:ATP-dependent DNA ligase
MREPRGGEAIVCDETGLAVFDLIRGHRTLAGAVHCAFDLRELDGKELRREPIEKRKELLAELLDVGCDGIVGEGQKPEGARCKA